MINPSLVMAKTDSFGNFKAPVPAGRMQWEVSETLPVYILASNEVYTLEIVKQGDSMHYSFILTQILPS